MILSGVNGVVADAFAGGVEDGVGYGGGGAGDADFADAAAAQYGGGGWRGFWVGLENGHVRG